MDIEIHELELFCNRWLDKAKSCPDNLTGCFDKFTSLYVAFNRVYTEAGKVLIAQGKVKPSKKGKYAPLPDRESATSHIVDYYSEPSITNELANNPRCKQAVETLAAKYRTKVVRLAETGFDAHLYSETLSVDSQIHTERYSWLCTHAF